MLACMRTLALFLWLREGMIISHVHRDIVLQTIPAVSKSVHKVYAISSPCRAEDTSHQRVLTCKIEALEGPDPMDWQVFAL